MGHNKYKIWLGVMVSTFISGCNIDNSRQQLALSEQDPDLLFSQQLIISQALPSMCLALEDTKLTLADCDLGQSQQRWSFSKSSGQLINSQSGQCVALHGKSLVSEQCGQKPQQVWRFEQTLLALDGRAIDVNLKNNKLIPYAAHGGSNQSWLVPSLAQAYVSNYQTHATHFPLNLDDKIGYELEVKKDLINRLTPLNQPLPYPRDIRQFPGEIESGAKRVNRSISVDREFYEMDLPGIITRKHWVSTGLYAPAGEVINLEVQQQGIDDLYVIINVHTDVLTPSSGNVKRAKEFKRYPSVSSKKKLQSGMNQIRSQYGGQVIIYSAKSYSQPVDIKISNVVEAPHFKLGRDSVDDWPLIVSKPAPWGVIEGNGVYLDLPKAALKQIENPAKLIEKFDEGLGHIHDLAGFDNGFGVNRKPTIKERFVDDVQITAGFAHANYPIMTSPGWELHSYDRVANKGWGNWHELGHNYQMFCMWSSPFGSESTVNIYSLYVQEILNSESRIVNESRYSKAISKLSDPDFNFVKDTGAWDKLIFIMQIKHAFPELGWDVFRQLNRRYRELDNSQQQKVCDSDVASFDQTFEFLTDITQRDLTEHFQTWKIPVSQTSLDKVARLKLPKPTVNISAVNPETKQS